MTVAIEPLPIDSSLDFWTKVKTKIARAKLGVFSDNGLLYVTMSDTAKMVPFVRDKEELFSTTIRGNSGKYRVIINGQFYGLSKAGIADTLLGNDPVDPNHTTPQGLVIHNGTRIGGKETPQMFHMANYWNIKPRYRFQKGIAPSGANSAVGGCGPLIISGMPFGQINKYKPGVSGKLHGEPIVSNKKHLVQRSNLTFSAFIKRPPYTGKTIVAYSFINSVVCVLVLPHGATGISLPDVRDKLVGANFSGAVFLDGSDSSLLVVDDDFLCAAAPNKDETNVVGIGFEVGA